MSPKTLLDLPKTRIFLTPKRVAKKERLPILRALLKPRRKIPRKMVLKIDPKAVLPDEIQIRLMR